MWEPVKKYLKRNCISFSCLICTLTGGPNYQTFSARNWYLHRRGQLNFHRLIDPIFKKFAKQEYHCMESWVHWRVRKDVMEDFAKQKLIE